MSKNKFRNELQGLAESVKNLRDIYKWSQGRLAKKAGVCRSVIADIEQEKRFPEMVNFLKLCNALDVSPAELCGEAFRDFTVKENSYVRNKRHKALRDAMRESITKKAMEMARLQDRAKVSKQKNDVDTRSVKAKVTQCELLLVRGGRSAKITVKDRVVA